MIDRVLSLTCEILEASCRPAPKDAHENSAFTGPLWDVQIPHTRQVIPFLLDYARCGQSVRLDANGRTFATLKLMNAVADDDAMSVGYSRSLFSGDRENCAVSVPYLHPKARPLFSGEWTRFGIAQVKLGSILPTVTWENEQAVIRWPTTPQVQVKEKGPLGIFDWTVRGGIKEIQIGEFKGRVVFTRRIVTLLCPDAEWS